MPMKNIHFIRAIKAKHIGFKEDALIIVVDKTEENGLETEVMFSFSLNEKQKLKLLKDLEEEV